MAWHRNADEAFERSSLALELRSGGQYCRPEACVERNVTSSGDFTPFW